MERKYIMQLPRGAKVSSTDIKCEDGKIVLTAQLEEWKPEDGEICYVRDRTGREAIFIMRRESRSTYYYACLDWQGKVLLDGRGLDDFEFVCLHPATDDEKQRLFDALAKQNKRWNAEKKVVEDMRWRAKKGETYYFLTFAAFNVFNTTRERNSELDDANYDKCNYFKTEEAARITGNQILELLKNSKAE